LTGRRNATQFVDIEWFEISREEHMHLASIKIAAKELTDPEIAQRVTAGDEMHSAFAGARCDRIVAGFLVRKESQARTA
jgi:hypothetical protein